MIELAFVVCMAAAPTDCEDRSLQFTDVTVSQCTMGAMPVLAEWIGQHPDWTLSSWTCRELDLGLEA